MIQLNLILGLGRAALCVMTAASTALAAPAFAQQTRTQSFTYNSRGEMITARVVNPAGADLSSSFGYDDVGNLTSTTAPGGLVMQADYDPARRVTEIRRDPNGATRSVSRFDYDVLGRLTRSRAGRVASPNPLTASHWADSSFTYSVDGLLTQATGPDGASIVYDYDPVGRLTRTQDPTGRISGYDYHADGRLKRLYEAVGTSGETAVIDLTYNGIGERERIRQARGIAGNPGVASESATYDTTYQYDAFNRLEQTVYPRPTSLSPHQTESFLYDANGNLEQHTTRRGDVISSSFDASNRLETRTTPEGVYRFEYYLTGEPKISRAPAGQDLEWRTVNNYDFAGRHTVEGQYLVQASGGGAYLIDRVVRYQYDANGNRTRIQWPDGFFVTYLYDAANRLTTICYNSSNCSTNLIARYEYDVQDRATRYTVYGAAGASVVQSDYDYSIDSDLTDLDVSFLRPGSNGQTVSFDYTYDAAGRLTGQDISNADWDWSPAQAGSPLSATYVANPLDQYESVDGQAFTYDLNGNLTAYRGQTLVYSSENRLETLSGAGVEADFSYDAEGRRKRMLVGNTSTEFVHAGTMEIAEYDGDTGALLRRYIPGPGVDQRVLMITCGSSADCAPNQSGADTYAYTADRLGHVIAVTHTRTGAIERYVYSPYGVELRGDESGNPFRYTGRRYDAETGLYYYRARYYDADLGRFLSTDPIGYADQWNLYAYVGNDPINATDPTGMEAWLVSRPLGIGALDKRGTRHMFVVVADELGGEVTARYSYGPSGPAYNPGNLVSLSGTGTPTDLDDGLAWESLANGGAEGVSIARINASDDAVMIAGDHVNAVLGTPDRPGTTSYAAATGPVTRETSGNSNSAAMAVANAARAASGLDGGQALPQGGGVRAPGHGQSDHIPVNQGVIDASYERVAVTGSRIRRRLED